MIVALEGIDCSGKSTQAKLLYDHFKPEMDTKMMHFPNKGSVYGGLIYDYLAGKIECDSPTIEAYHTMDKLISQDGIYDYSETMDGLLIVDRYALAQFAYAKANSVNLGHLFSVIHSFITPDVRLFLDISPEQALLRKSDYDKYESDKEFMEKVYKSYIMGCEAFGYKSIDASKSINEVHEQIMRYVESAFTNKR